MDLNTYRSLPKTTREEIEGRVGPFPPGGWHAIGKWFYMAEPVIAEVLRAEKAAPPEVPAVSATEPAPPIPKTAPRGPYRRRTRKAA